MRLSGFSPRLAAAMFVFALALKWSAGATVTANASLVWAYGTDPAAVWKSPEKPSDEQLALKGSDLKFTAAQIQDKFGPADWYPNDHAPMPPIVAHGRKNEVWACALCHYPNGRGKPENASVIGFPASYFVEQMHEFRDGQRQSADARKKNTALMSAFAKGMTDEEIDEAAKYFSNMKPTRWIRIIESERVPKTRTSVGMYLPIPNGGTEPLGKRIIEMPVDAEATETLRDPHSGFVAYVPPGSLQRGKDLVLHGAGKTEACAICHGADLQGLGPLPGIAGRSPSYLARQLYDMQQGTRRGSWTELMKPVVKNLSEADILDIAAYTASLNP